MLNSQIVSRVLQRGECATPSRTESLSDLKIICQVCDVQVLELLSLLYIYFRMEPRLLTNIFWGDIHVI